MKTLLIDNYDSFTYNLFQLIAEANGEEPTVVRNDGASWSELAGGDFDNVVISPGPGRPDDPKDFGICADAIRDADVPLLGVCLGHQGIGHIAGAEVVHAPEVMHGRMSAVYHDDSPLFADIPQGFTVVRYHSLCITEPLPEDLEAIAWTADGIVMGAAHRKRPVWGVQFHPESICTDWGRRLLANFRDMTAGVAGGKRTPLTQPATNGGGPKWSPPQRPRLRLQVERIDRLYDTEQVFVNLYGDHRYAFWLDSSKVDERSRFSFMGASGGPLSSVVTSDVDTGMVNVARGLSSEEHEESIFDYLSREMKRLRYLSDDLPFDFNCGFVGYFGYELKADCEGDNAFESSMPDAAFVFADRLLAFDHYEKCTLPALRHRADHRGGGAALDPRDRRAPRGAAAARACGSGGDHGRRLARRVPPEPLAPAVPGRHPDDQGLPHGGRHLRGLPHEQGARGHLARAAAALPDAAPHQPGALLVLPALRRRRGPELLARALPLDRPRRLDGGQADQGHLPARQGPRRGPAARGDAADG